MYTIISPLISTIQSLVFLPLQAGWWNDSWYPSFDIFLGMVCVAFWWGLAVTIAAIPLLIIIAIGIGVLNS